MRARTQVLALLTLLLWPLRASAGEPENKVQEKQLVHVGSASVTVVDEHEAVDDVITRIRTGKNEPATDKTKDVVKQPPSGQAAGTASVNKDSGRASLQVVRDRATARTENERRKDERRERAATARARTEQKRH